MAVTVAYEHPIAGAGPPTALQVADMVTATVIASADADTNAVITHNMGLSAADLAAGRPVVILEPGVAEAAAARLSNWAVTAKDANTVTVNKTNAVGSGAAGIQLRVHISRPHSVGR